MTTPWYRTEDYWRAWYEEKMYAMLKNAPGKIIVAGDWHGNGDWAEHVITMAAELLADEAPRVIVQLGDFGIWPGATGEHYLAQVRAACKKHNVRVYFIDGNHEDFTQLIVGGQLNSGATHVEWLPRGTRWTWHDRTWLACGGAVSLDRAVRIQGVSWWPQEEITEDEELYICGTGHADVMLTHDCPMGVTHSFPPPPRFWDVRDLARSDAHRERLQRIVDAVAPSYLMHGHLHRAYQRELRGMQVTGLDMDDGDGPNYLVLDIRSMTWEALSGV